MPRVPEGCIAHGQCPGRLEVTRLTARPMTRDQANAYIVEHHRHHGRVTGHRFIVGAELRGELVGVAVGGRPRARMVEQYRHVEVSRLCSAGERNVCSFLYSRCARIAREMGFASIFTAILESESGASLYRAKTDLEEDTGLDVYNAFLDELGLTPASPRTPHPLPREEKT